MIKKVLMLFVMLSFISTISASVLEGPIEINDCDGLRAISDNLEGDYYLTADIYCETFEEFTPLGSSENPFTGTLDGRGHKIGDIVIKNYFDDPSTIFPPSDQGESLGLFSHTGPTAKIVRLELEYPNVMGNQESGSLVGYNKGEIKNCTVRSGLTTYAIVNTTYKNAYQASGGLVGVNEGTIINSHVKDSIVLIEGGYYGGGLVGFNYGDIIDSSFSGELNLGSISPYDSYYGGLVGGSYDGLIKNSNVSGKINGTGFRVGGLVGRCFNNCRIEQSFSNSSITSGGTISTVGGLVGVNEGQIINSYSHGNLDVGLRAGGLVGLLSSGSIINSYSMGQVIAEREPKGGLVGQTSGGYAFSSYWDTTSSGQISSPSGIGFNTTFMTNESTYLGWDFTGTWVNDTFKINDGYPYLQWQTQGCVADGCNGNCPSGCTSTEDDDCNLSKSCCGNGICGPSETAESCSSDCGPYCGDRTLNTLLGEECDPPANNCIDVLYGQTCNFCSDTCENATISGGYCGDGIINESYEACDNATENTNEPCKPGLGSSCAYCTPECELKELTYYQMSWIDINGGLITEAGKSGTVAMIIWDTGIVKNPSDYYFEIYESDTGLFNFDDAIREGSNAIDGEDHNFTDGNASIAYWTISKEDLDKAGDDLNNFYFRVYNASSGIYLEKSNNLSINEDIETEMEVTLEQPYCGQLFVQNQKMHVVVPKTSAEDIVDGEILIEDNIYYFDNRGISFDYKLNNPGVIEVLLHATNNQGESTTQRKSIIVADNSKPDTYVAACINEPADISSGIETGTVKFSADQTTAVRYDPSIGFTPIPEDKLRFYWEFSDGRTNPYINGDNPLSQSFYKNFANPGGGWANLAVEVVE